MLTDHQTVCLYMQDVLGCFGGSTMVSAKVFSYLCLIEAPENTEKDKYCI